MSAAVGTGTLVRFFLRRDRWTLAAWVLGGAVLYWSQAVGLAQTYPTQAALDRAAASMGGNAALVAMTGPARALDTLGGQVAWQVSAYGAILAGLMSMFLVGRHTRAEEETGRDELVRSGVVGRHAPVLATVVVVALANLLLALGVAVSLVASDLPGAGSWALGVAAGVAGLVFGGVALVAAQLTQGVRSVYGITASALGVAYVLRAIGDVSSGIASWLSPIGWGQAMRAYAGEVWWPAALSVAVAGGLWLVAVRVLDHRDIGHGLWPARPGPARAGRGLRGSLGLAWRLQRGALAGWAAGLLLMGLAYGSIGSDVRGALGDSSEVTEMMAQAGGPLVDSFYATACLLLALVAGGYAVQAGLRASGEEGAGRVESLLAAGLPRWRWLTGHVAVALAGTGLVVVLGGLGAGVGYGATTGDWTRVGPLTAATVAYLPAVWALVAVTVALYGLVGRWALLGWAGLAFCAAVMLFGPLLQLPAWVLDLSPFGHVPMLPVAALSWPALLELLVAVAVLLAVGVVAFRRRDVRTA